MHGAGNDFIICDNTSGQIDNLTITKNLISSKVCHRNFGVGADGFICASPVKDKIADIRMEYYNSDGSLAEMCGNGLRCFGKYVYELGLIKKERFKVETLDGMKEVSILKERENVFKIELDMGIWNNETVLNRIVVNDVTFEVFSTIFCVPHAVILLDKFEFASEKEEDEFILYYGSIIEKRAEYPNGINVNFIRIIDSGNIHVSTFERGAGKTLACGSGACASHAIGYKLFNLNEICSIKMPGGEVETRIDKSDRILLIGDAVEICKGSVNLI